MFWAAQSDFGGVGYIIHLARELPEQEREFLLNMLNEHLVKPLSEDELFTQIRKTLADESPSIRASSVNRLSNLSKEKAAELAEEAIKDEPDKLIKGLLKKFVAA